MLSYYLYSTLGCHLCENAKTMLFAVEADRKVIWEEIDIAMDPLLVDEYGIRIPVLRHLSSGGELCWPFTLDDLKVWLTQTDGAAK